MGRCDAVLPSPEGEALLTPDVMGDAVTVTVWVAEVVSVVRSDTVKVVREMLMDPEDV